MNTPHTYTDQQITETIKSDNIANGLALTGAPKLARERAIRVLDAQAASAAAMVECRECGGTGQIPAGIDREAGRDPGRDCWKCHGYGEHIR
jgi:hypothetical protein